MRCFVILILPILSFFTSCKTFVPVIKMKDVDQVTLTASKKVKVFVLGQDPGEYEYIDSITAWSAKHLLTDPPATRGDAIAQAKVICVRKGGDALMNLTFDEQGTDTWGTNAWESISLSADVIKLSPKTIPNTQKTSAPQPLSTQTERSKKLLDMYLNKEITKDEYFELRKDIQKTE
jgi:hypothetical protein